MRFIDSHAHLTSDALYADIEAVLDRAQQAGADAVINICTNALTLERGLSLSEKYPWVYNAAATTPHDAATEGETLFPFMENHLLSGKLAAVGETGLDYHYYDSTKEAQKKLLSRYLHLALSANLPVIIHCREAFSDLFQILDSDYKVGGKHAPGVLHCFTGTEAEARQVLERGWYLSLSGITTFKKSSALREIAAFVPLDQLLVETDAPYLAPQTHRSKLNEPAYLREIIDTIAQAKSLDKEQVAQTTAANARRLFKLTKSSK